VKTVPITIDFNKFTVNGCATLNEKILQRLKKNPGDFHFEAGGHYNQKGEFILEEISLCSSMEKEK
jgi:hypothetical protein